MGSRARGAGPLGPEYGGPEPWATSSPGMFPNELGGRHTWVLTGTAGEGLNSSRKLSAQGCQKRGQPKRCPALWGVGFQPGTTPYPGPLCVSVLWTQWVLGPSELELRLTCSGQVPGILFNTTRLGQAQHRSG